MQPRPARRKGVSLKTERNPIANRCQRVPPYSRWSTGDRKTRNRSQDAASPSLPFSNIILQPASTYRTHARAHRAHTGRVTVRHPRASQGLIANRCQRVPPYSRWSTGDHKTRNRSQDAASLSLRSLSFSTVSLQLYYSTITTEPAHTAHTHAHNTLRLFGHPCDICGTRLLPPRRLAGLSV